MTSYLIVQNGKRIKDCDELQRDLYPLREWEAKWQWPFNVSKCKVMPKS